MTLLNRCQASLGRIQGMLFSREERAESKPNGCRKNLRERSEADASQRTYAIRQVHAGSKCTHMAAEPVHSVPFASETRVHRKGQALEEALHIEPNEKALGRLSEEHVHCARPAAKSTRLLIGLHRTGEIEGV